jgi:hypothetical protein
MGNPPDDFDRFIRLRAENAALRARLLKERDDG